MLDSLLPLAIGMGTTNPGAAAFAVIVIEFFYIVFLRHRRAPETVNMVFKFHQKKKDEPYRSALLLNVSPTGKVALLHEFKLPANIGHPIFERFIMLKFVNDRFTGMDDRRMVAASEVHADRLK